MALLANVNNEMTFFTQIVCICLRQGLFVDRCLPMGCSISCAYSEMFSTFL